MTDLYNWIFCEEADLSKRALITQTGTYTLGDLKKSVKEYHSILKDMGDIKGKKVAIIVPGVATFLSILLTVNKLGGTVVPISPLLRKEDLTQILSFIDPHIVFTVKEHNGFYLEKTVRAWAGSVGEEVAIIESADGHEWKTEIIAGKPKRREADHSPYIIGCTSGSTGTPKGIIVDRAFFEFAERALTKGASLSKEDKVFLVVPTSVLYGLCWLLAGLHSQITIVATESFSFPAILKLMKWNPANKLVTSPSLFKALCMFDKVSDISVLKSLTEVSLAGEMITAEFFEGLDPLHHCKITSMYGLSELGALMYTESDIREGVEWSLTPGVAYNLENLSKEGVGELHFKTPCKFLGYYKCPELTEELYKEGWFSTGDLAKITSEQKIKVVGRKKDMIKKGGQQVIRGEIEQMLTKHEAVEKAAVLGMPHAIFGEQVIAFIIKKKEIPLSEIYNYCRDRLASFKVPDKIFILEDIPLVQGKVDKVTLKQEAQKLIANIEEKS
ncbi:class I adenylate-forming enzyme family protein [Pseudobacillus sp. 179-B 2D1 NHS]|uniref:class I adenylate-forming enzyme family protein n=1 Tax=Pseudobacillus sp. 179-B 2D1 NHS TaxID=3374292 RepID=UPI00387A5D06